MPSKDAPEVIIARWLRQNNYEKTLSSFLDEAGLPPDAGPLTSETLSLEQLLEEKRLYDQSVNYEKHTEATKQTWTLPAPSIPKILDVPLPSNVLNVAVQRVATSTGWTQERLFITMADRRLLETITNLHLEDVNTPDECVEQVLTQDSPILSWTSVLDVNRSQSIGTTMSGRVFIYTHDGSRPMIERTDHTRYCIKAAISTSDASQRLLATIGWDSRLNIYHLDRTDADQITELSNPASTLSLPSIPEDIIWISNPYHDASSSEANPDHVNILLLTRRDSSVLHYYLPTSPSPTLIGRQNLAPHAISWTVFTPSSIALCPTDPTLLAVATSSLPHLKLIIVHLLIPDPRISTDMTTTGATTTPQDRAIHLAIANRDEAAITQHISTLAPQTPYSTPKVVWRADGSGVWVNGDDGCVRGIETSTGKVVAVLKGGHESMSKVRTLWAGRVGGEEDGIAGEEWVVSGGFDRRVVIWKVGAMGEDER